MWSYPEFVDMNRLGFKRSLWRSYQIWRNGRDALDHKFKLAMHACMTSINPYAHYLRYWAINENVI